MFTSLLESSEKLPTHLKTCEVYESGRCYERFALANHLKTYAEDDHGECDYFLHIKMDRNDRNDGNDKPIALRQKCSHFVQFNLYLKRRLSFIKLISLFN